MSSTSRPTKRAERTRRTLTRQSLAATDWSADLDEADDDTAGGDR